MELVPYFLGIGVFATIMAAVHTLFGILTKKNPPEPPEGNWWDDVHIQD